MVLNTSRRSPSSRPSGPGEVVITALGAGGDGIGRSGGKPVYVPLTVPGDRVRLGPAVPRGDGLAAEAVAVLAPGPDRVAPVCPHFGACGGCAVQHLESAAYGVWKTELVATALARVGLGGVPVAPVLRLPPGSRRRAVFACVRRGGKLHLGFNRRGSDRIEPVSACAVLDPRIVALLPALAGALEAVVTVAAPVDVGVTVLEGGLDVVLTGGVSSSSRAASARADRATSARAELGLAAREALAAFAEAADIARLSWRPGVQAAAEPVAWRRSVVARFGGVAVAVPPGGFLQPSVAGESALVGLVRAGVEGAGRIADLFAGCGSFSLPLAAAAKVTAVEGDAAAVAALAQAASVSGGVKVVRRDLFTTPLIGAELDGFEAVVFDPPRAGAMTQAAALARSAVPVVVGVSCNPVSFARDARILVAGGYELLWVVPVDQFLWSAHVELVGVFTRNRGSGPRGWPRLNHLEGVSP